MRKMMRASLLVLALSCSAYAGHIPNDFEGNMPFPAPATSGAPGESVGGDIPNNRPAEGTLTGAVLVLLRGLLSLP